MFGWVYETYSLHERGERGIKKAAGKYAVAFGVSEAWLLTGEGEMDGSARSTSVPLISWVSAGNLDVPDAIDDIATADRISVGQLPAGDWVALTVIGDSMDRISPPGSVIIVNRRERTLFPNACYVIATGDDGSSTYKRYRSNPDRFEPVSTNPSHEIIFPEGAITIIGRVKKSFIDM